MTILASILFIISPILSMPVVLLGLFLEKKHKRYLLLYCSKPRYGYFKIL